MIQFCKKCLFPDTKPDLYFDENGFCDACSSAQQKWNGNKSINWEKRSQEFDDIILACSAETCLKVLNLFSPASLPHSTILTPSQPLSLCANAFMSAV